MASSAPPTPSASEPRPAPTTRLGNFWQRVSEGRRIDDLWSQFAADARSSYGFYGKDVDWDEVNQLSRWKRPLRVAKQLFWAMMNKLTPARRVLFLAAVGLLSFLDSTGRSVTTTPSKSNTNFSPRFSSSFFSPSNSPTRSR